MYMTLLYVVLCCCYVICYVMLFVCIVICMYCYLYALLTANLLANHSILIIHSYNTYYPLLHLCSLWHFLLHAPLLPLCLVTDFFLLDLEPPEPRTSRANSCPAYVRQILGTCKVWTEIEKEKVSSHLRANIHLRNTARQTATKADIATTTTTTLHTPRHEAEAICAASPTT